MDDRYREGRGGGSLDTDSTKGKTKCILHIYYHLYNLTSGFHQIIVGNHFLQNGGSLSPAPARPHIIYGKYQLYIVLSLVSLSFGVRCIIFFDKPTFYK